MKQLIFKTISKIPGRGTIYKFIIKPLSNLLLLEMKFIGAEYKYNEQGLITDKNCDFIKDPDFLYGLLMLN